MLDRGTAQGFTEHFPGAGHGERGAGEQSNGKILFSHLQCTQHLHNTVDTGGGGGSGGRKNTVST